jgi:very-short-patch-repair endonuclease
MGSSKRQPTARAWGLARAQHGAIAWRQLRELGLSAQAIQHRIGTGRLFPVGRGVYAVGRADLTRHGRWMAAVLSAGPGAVLSHGSAAALWGFGVERSGRIEVSVPSCAGRLLKAIDVHRRPRLRASDTTSHERIPVTGVVRTMVDIASRVEPVALERAIGEADRLERIDPEALLAALDDYANQNGVGKLRHVLVRRAFRLTDSELERRFLRLVERAGLPVPETGARVNGFKVDFHWPELGLVVETDGLRYHRTPAQQARDHLRDQAHVAAGLASLRFTHEQVRYEPKYVRGVLEATVAEAEARPPRQSAGSPTRSPKP